MSHGILTAVLMVVFVIYIQSKGVSSMSKANEKIFFNSSAYIENISLLKPKTTAKIALHIVKTINKRTSNSTSKAKKLFAVSSATFVGNEIVIWPPLELKSVVPNYKINLFVGSTNCTKLSKRHTCLFDKILVSTFALIYLFLTLNIIYFV